MAEREYLVVLPDALSSERQDILKAVGAGHMTSLLDDRMLEILNMEENLADTLVVKSSIRAAVAVRRSSNSHSEKLPRPVSRLSRPSNTLPRLSSTHRFKLIRAAFRDCLRNLSEAAAILT